MNQNKSDLKTLISEIKEQILYLEELGVSEYSFALSDDSPKIIERKDLDHRVSAQEIKDLVSGVQKKPGEEEKYIVTVKPRRDILNTTRISDVSKNTEVPARPRVPEEKSMVEPLKQAHSVSPTELEDSTETVNDIRKEIGADCSRCELCESRTQVVNSVGNETADLMIVGEAPGADEDIKGEPFVGRAGKLLTKILEAIGFERRDVFIGNINRCRPPGNRQPTLEESAICKPFLLREIAAVRPKVIVVLGNTATKNLLETTTGITKLRGNFEEFRGVKVMPTFHPAYLLRDPRKKREVWEDMKKVRDYLNTFEK